MRKSMCMNPLWMMWNWSPMAMMACAPRAKQAEVGLKNVVETAAGAASFQTLLKAAGAAALADALKGTGPFTVFAPTDQAFAALSAGTLEELLKPENKARLADLLKYHVAPGRILASEVVRLRSIRSLNGRDLPIRAQGGVVLIDDVRIAQADLLCSNGVIHVLDGVLLPK